MEMTRRPVAARGNRWIKSLASHLAASSVTPNQISLASVVFAGFAAFALLWRNSLGDFLAIIGVQLRLLCNVVDGLVAIEGGKKTALGSLYNEFPDRVSDVAVLVAAGYACGLPAWGWSGAILAVLTAYVRVFGGAMGFPQDFRGVMAKKIRMHTISIGCAVGIFAPSLYSLYGLRVAVMIVAVGSAVTCATRAQMIARLLQAAHSPGD